ncbi:MAG: 3-oxo-tetronate kinase [Alkalilacustris sp.]
MLLGCIGDDFTGSSDLGNTLSKAGMACVQYVGVPDGPAEPGVEAGIVALKSRSIPADQAVAQALAALEWLRAQGARQILFKVCSTFDSTDAGNIGPVTEALADALGATCVPVCPAFPATGRTVYQGHLFVSDRLLSESGMEHHPLTPMRDPDLRRVLARQSRGAVGHLGLSDLRRRGSEALAAPGPRLIIVDAIEDDDLVALGRAAADLPLLTGGSGIALGLPANFAARGLLRDRPSRWAPQPGPAVALAGSCSRATLGQVAHHATHQPLRAIGPEEAMGEVDIEALADWAMAQARAGAIPLIASSAPPQDVAAAQQLFGTTALAQAVEALFADLARALLARGVARLITAGGETSGVVVTGLGLGALRIGPEIDPGVPMIRTEVGGRDLVLALKSGNFGAEDFFAKAAAMMEAGA